MTAVMSSPPLPSSLITQLLTHLLPPSPPLPTELISKSLLHRLLYLPPASSDIDAQLTPFPWSSTSTSADDSQPLTSRLRELARGHRLSPISYAREEHEIWARVTIHPEIGVHSVEVWFELESEADGRGWVYHSSRIPTEDTLRWVDQPYLLPPAPVSEPTHDDTTDPTAAPDGYWAAFDSPSSSTFVSADDEDTRGEDAYWAQYSRPETAPITPGNGEHPHPHPAPNGFSYGRENAMVDRNDPKKVAEAVTRSLNALKASRKTSYAKRGVDLADKVRGKISGLLSEAWMEFGGRSTSEEREERALEWLNTARSVIDRPSFGRDQISDLSHTSIIRAKMQVLVEMYDVLGEEEDGFWRMVESTIRTAPRMELEDEETRQAMYYE